MQTQQQNQYPRPSFKSLHPINQRNTTTMMAQNVFLHPSSQSSGSYQNQPPIHEHRKTFDPKDINNNQNAMTKIGSIQKNKQNRLRETHELQRNPTSHSFKPSYQVEDDDSFKVGSNSQPKHNPYNHELLQRPWEVVGKRRQVQREYRHESNSNSRSKQQQSELVKELRKKKGEAQTELKNYYNNNSEQEEEFIGGQEIQLYPENKAAYPTKKKDGIGMDEAECVEERKQKEQKKLYQKFGLDPPRNKREAPQRQNIDNYLRNQNAHLSNNTDSNSYNNSIQSNNDSRSRAQPRLSPKLPQPHTGERHNQFIDSRQSYPTSNSKYGPGGIQTLEFNPEKEKLIILDSKETENNINFYSNKLVEFCENIVVPPLEELPVVDNTPEELVGIAKTIFTSFGCKINEQTVINVRKYRNCVFFSIDLQNNVLYHYDNGKLYYGGWKISPNGEGEKEGHGLEILPGRYKFKGYFIEGKKHGMGTLINSVGSAYVGQWKSGMKHGSGRELDQDGIVYEGEWKEGKKSGFGKLINNDRLQFEGVFSKGLKNGYGKQYFENGDRYDGNYLNHKFDGKGTYIWRSGATYTGEFKNGKRNGFGEWKSSQTNFDTYQGQYVEDMKHGQGIYKWHNGAIYQGQFRDDLKHGQGTIIYENGKVANLIWNQGKAERKISIDQEKSSTKHHLSERIPLNRGGSSTSQPQIHALQSQVHVQSQTKQKQNNVVFRSRVSSRSTQNLHSAGSTSSSGIKNYPKGVAFHTNSMNKLLKDGKKTAKKNDQEMIRLKFDNNQFQKAIGKNWNKNIQRESFGHGRPKEAINRPDLPKDRPYQGIQNSANINFDL